MMVYDPNDDDKDDGDKVIGWIALGLILFIMAMIAVLYFSIR